MSKFNLSYPKEKNLGILSFTEEANRLLMEKMQFLSNDLIIKDLRSQYNTDSSYESPNDFLYISSVILMLEKDGLNDPDYRNWTSWCVTQVAQRVDFRLFVCLYDLSRIEFENAIKEDDLLKELKDTVQISESFEIEDMLVQVARFYEHIGDLRDINFFRNFRLQLAPIIELALGLIQLVCLLFMFAISISYYVFTGSTAFPLGLFGVNLISFLGGVILFPPLTVMIFILTRQAYISTNQTLKRKLSIQAGISYLIICGSLWQLIAMSANLVWAILGFAFGMIMDISRRNARQTRTTLNQVDASQIVYSHDKLLNTFKNVLDGDLPNPFSLNIFAADLQRVLISYTRSSEWSRHHALTLYEELNQYGNICFIDKSTIQEGSNWRYYLRKALGEADVVVAIIDEQTLGRKWPAAEIETALKRRSQIGKPDVLFIISAKINNSQYLDKSCLPIFNIILKNADHVKTIWRPRYIFLENPMVLPTIASLLRPTAYYSISIIPAQWTLFLQFLAIPLKLVLTTIGVLGTPIGLLTTLIFILHFTGFINIAQTLFPFIMYSPLRFLLSFWMGFVLRLAIESRYSLKIADRKAVSVLNLIFACSFFLLLLPVLMNASLSIIGWIAVCLCFGWIYCGSFVKNIRFSKPNMDLDSLNQ